VELKNRPVFDDFLIHARDFWIGLPCHEVSKTEQNSYLTPIRIAVSYYLIQMSCQMVPSEILQILS
jgi:hypothetical protein